MHEINLHTDVEADANTCQLLLFTLYMNRNRPTALAISLNREPTHGVLTTDEESMTQNLSVGSQKSASYISIHFRSSCLLFRQSSDLICFCYSVVLVIE